MIKQGRLGYWLSLAFALGVSVGGAGVWLYYVSDKPDSVDQSSVDQRSVDQSQLMEQLLAHAEVGILDEYYGCEGKPVKTVGAVVSSLLEFNAASRSNKLSYGCYQNTCSMSFSHCKPWQGKECSSRFLTFELHEGGAINPASFRCFDLP